MCKETYSFESSPFRPVVELVHTTNDTWWWHVRDKRTTELMYFRCSKEDLEQSCEKLREWNEGGRLHDLIFATDVKGQKSLGVRLRNDKYFLLDYFSETWLLSEDSVNSFLDTIECSLSSVYRLGKARKRDVGSFEKTTR